jgi:hypothetical protein
LANGAESGRKMKNKRFLWAILTAAVFLAFEFKLVPFLLKTFKVFHPQKLSPVAEEEEKKFNLIFTLKEAGFIVARGPFWKKEIRGLETVLLLPEGKLTVIFSVDNEPRAQAASLQLVLKEAKMKQGSDFRLPKLIDLSGEKAYASF